jgi:CHAD domain-containing protein
MSELESPHSFGDWAVVALTAHFRKITKYDQRVLEDQDPEDLHQLRVGMRRLRTALVGFGSALQLPPLVTEKRVGRMARVLGVLRDNDVLQEILANLGPIPANEQDYLESVQDYLRQKRKQAFKSTKKILTQAEYGNFKTQMERWLHQPQLTTLAVYPIGDILPDLLLPLLGEFFLHPGWLVLQEINPGNYAGVPSLDLETLNESLAPWEKVLHDLRKSAKRTRYQLELFTRFYGADYQELIERIKIVQDCLGQLQDYFVLAQVMEKSLALDIATFAPHLTALLAGDRLGAWQTWQPQQHYFLNVQHRHQCRLLLQSPQILS